ncbi:TetR/AcrR family transcriptional regulator [Cyclobacterium sp.]|uniref:TetR/AcrR family transcriptional regulator n=1 Tax=Cyclobacterium sp. TaxID=1966343 RepID=UPI0019CA91C8|nr:TetR/AcrR family transcriptional regulator [Cyclobacterium sp.]MBD3631304.1 TetR/AcrR family transcriptional regulator [Cyclobacterium sp.]
MENISDKKKAIFESTINLITENGFHGTPMSMVAKNAGVAVGTIYHYFESKNQLIGELHAYNRGRVVEIIKETIGENISHKKTFQNIWTNLYQFYIENTNVLIFFEQFINSPYNINKFPTHFQGELFDFFKGGIGKGEIKDVKPEILVVLTLGSITTSAKLHKFGSIPLNFTDQHNIIQILWDGMAVNKE